MSDEIFLFWSLFQAYEPPADWAKLFMITLIILGAGFTISELICYIIFFSHVFYHDNMVAVFVVKREVVRQRNHANSISMAGLFATWFMEVAYICWIILLFTSSEFGQIREMLTIVKMSEFVVVPVMQILTSPTLRKSIKES